MTDHAKPYPHWPDWRPVSEAPRPGQLVLVTIASRGGFRFVELASIDSSRTWHIDHTIWDAWCTPLDDAIVAWMPVPPACTQGAPGSG